MVGFQRAALRQVFERPLRGISNGVQAGGFSLKADIGFFLVFFFAALGARNLYYRVWYLEHRLHVYAFDIHRSECGLYNGDANISRSEIQANDSLRHLQFSLK